MELKRFGRYEAIRPIASGGMATVYLGRALGAGGFQRLVAIKVMHSSIAGDPSFLSMFLDEGRIAAGIHHPNVVATLDVQEGDEGLYMVLEYIAGCSLHALIRRLREEEGALVPLPIALRIMLDVLEGLNAAHQLVGPRGKRLKVVHRDISPHNILLGVDGIARITDFGVARAESRLSKTQHGQIKGKIAYMSVEQLRGDEVDLRTDVYAAGVVLWELLAGRRLFQAKDRAELAMAVLDGTHEAPSTYNPTVPEALDEVCMVALRAKDDRHASAATFAQAIHDAATESGVVISLPAAVGALAKKVDQGVGSLPPLPTEPARADEPRVVTTTAATEDGRGSTQQTLAADDPPTVPPVASSTTEIIDPAPAALPLAKTIEMDTLVSAAVRDARSAHEVSSAASDGQTDLGAVTGVARRRASGSWIVIAIGGCAVAGAAIWLMLRGGISVEPQAAGTAATATAMSAALRPDAAPHATESAAASVAPQPSLQSTSVRGGAPLVAPLTTSSVRGPAHAPWPNKSKYSDRYNPDSP